MKPYGLPGIGKFTATIFLAMATMLLCAGALTAQSPPATVGVLTRAQAWTGVLDGLREGLAKLEYKEGQNIRFIFEESTISSPALDPLAAKLVEAKPDVIFAVTPALAAAAKRATSLIPIVFVLVGAPVEAGLVFSFASSKNNLTGISSYAASLSGKRLELLKEIAPRTKKVLLIASTQEAISQISARHSEEAAKKIGLQILRRDMANTADFDKLLLGRWAGIADAVFPVTSVLTGIYIERIVKKANNEKLPSFVYEEDLVETGALASYGSGRLLTGIQAARLVAKILKGARPSDIPIETPDRFVFAVNLTTARGIGLNIPRKVLARTDHLVE